MLKALKESCIDAALRPTDGPGRATGLARDAIAAGADLILACGGDGTINEIANGMIGAKAPLGIIPAGTANVLGNELGLGTFETAARRIATSDPQRIPLGRLHTAAGQERYFLMMAGAGLDAAIAARVDAGLKKRYGKLAYWIAGLGALGRPLDEFEVDTGEVQRRVSFALMAKVSNYGGDLKIARAVRVTDHTFEVVLFAGRSPVRYLKYLAGVLGDALEGMRGVTVTRAQRILLTSPGAEGVHVQVDGECAGVLPAVLDMVPDALTLLIPPDSR